MSKNKLKRFFENKTLLQNIVCQPQREEVLNGYERKGDWANVFENKENPIVLELGCGRGEYSLYLAKKYPNKNFIGIDIKGARIWEGAKKAKEENLNNIIFVRTQIDLIDSIFGENEISEIWITFPDPQLKIRRAKHRLTNQFYLDKYRKIIKQNALMHLKTDNSFLYGYTLGVLDVLQEKTHFAHHDIYNTLHPHEDATGVETYYEKKFKEKGATINYILFELKKHTNNNSF